jgi:hypothetical protein
LIPAAAPDVSAGAAVVGVPLPADDVVLVVVTTVELALALALALALEEVTTVVPALVVSLPVVATTVLSLSSSDVGIADGVSVSEGVTVTVGFGGAVFGAVVAKLAGGLLGSKGRGVYEGSTPRYVSLLLLSGGFASTALASSATIRIGLRIALLWSVEIRVERSML